MTLIATYDPAKNVSNLIVMANVDAQNSYGAMIQETWVVSWSSTGDASKSTAVVWSGGRAFSTPGRIN